MKIVIFTEGTILMHKSAVDQTHEETVQQVINGTSSVKDYASYVPIGEAAQKIQTWADDNNEIIYLTSRRSQKEVNEIRKVLAENNFPAGALEYRRENEEYKDVIERIKPDLLIEDDCESIGGEKEMTYPHLSEQFKKSIESIVVKEFGGIDNIEI